MYNNRYFTRRFIFATFCNIRREGVKISDFILCHFYTTAKVLAKFIQRTAMRSNYNLNYILYKLFQRKKLSRVIYKIRE